MKNRIIVHYDMDSFYASVEIKRRPELKGKPVVVGEGVITTASYEARRFGVKSAMPVYEARKLCPGLISLPVNKELYYEVSETIQNLVKKITKKVEFIALDEGFIDVTEIINNYVTKEKFGNLFKERIRKLTGLTCSVGIGYNKLTAKIASDINKPFGIFIFNNEVEFIEYMGNKSIRLIPGVGNKLYENLKKISVEKVKDIYIFSHYELVKKFGDSRGAMLYYFTRGIDDSEVEFEKKNHSIGHENTYRYLLNSEEDVKREMDELFQRVYLRLLEEKQFSKTITLKIKTDSKKTTTKSYTFERPTSDKLVLSIAYEKLFEEIENFNNIKLVGISFGNLSKIYLEQLKFKD
ncbi:MAG: DNA polymerase IV [Fusobacteriaceae bacterium]